MWAPAEVAALEGLTDAPLPYTLGRPEPSLDAEDFASRVERIHELIAAGDTYQVNLTYRVAGDFEGEPLGLYRDLAVAQKAAFCAFLPVGDRVVISASPELFFRALEGKIELRPMKGTRPRGRWAEEDETMARDLVTSEKERAENLMIVDLIRNDLGRFAEYGSVDVPSLFEVERYPTVHQLTSTVTGRPRAGTGTVDVFRALFPSGSVTGAPKVRTSEIIRELEDSPRGVYTGAIGFLGPGESVFNVAIRTVVVEPSVGRYELGVGSGITADSDASAEFRECIAKAAFLTHRPPEFELLESLRLVVPGGYSLLGAHLDRVECSARYFGFSFDRPAVLRALDAEAERLSPGVFKVRLLVDRDGEVRVGSEAIPEISGDVRLRLARAPVDASDPFLFHKTTHRAIHTAAMQGVAGADDVVLFNRAGELTETTTANLVLELGGNLVTPPIECGLLAGTLRGELLATDRIATRTLHVDDLSRASAVYVINSVRGWRRAEVILDADPVAVLDGS